MFNFPSNPVEGQLYTPSAGPTYVFHSPVWQQIAGNFPSIRTALPRNRIVNPSMQISQENGDSGVSTVGGHGADQWQLTFAAATAMGLYRGQNVDMGAGLTTALVINVPTADTSIAAGDYLRAYQLIEGTRVADFAWGTANAKQVILRFKARHGVAGNYSVNVKNNGSTRSWLGEYTVSAGQVNVPVERILVIPGDTTGTWLRDNGIGMQVTFVVAAGTTFHGVAGWQAGNFAALPGIANGMGAITTHAFTDVGLYLDPDNTGVPPPWQMPDEAEELRACQRYWQKLVGYIVETGSLYQPSILSEVMRIAPAIAGGGAGFTLHNVTTNVLGVYQTTRAAQTLTLNARM